MRVDIKSILKNPVQKKKLMVEVIMSLQRMEGIETTREQAEKAYDYIQENKKEIREGLHK